MANRLGGVYVPLNLDQMQLPFAVFVSESALHHRNGLVAGVEFALHPFDLLRLSLAQHLLRVQLVRQSGDVLARFVQIILEHLNGLSQGGDNHCVTHLCP